MKLTNCLNCGAPLHGSRCEYCGTEYETENKPFSISLNEDNTHGVLTFMGVEFDVYLSSFEVEHPAIECTCLGDTTRTFITAPPTVEFTLTGTPKRGR